MGVYADRVRRKPNVIRNALLASLHTEMQTSSGMIVTQDTQSYRYDYSYNKYCEDHLTPGWEGLIARGVAVNSPFYINEVTERVVPTTFSGSRPGDDYLTTFFIRIVDDGTAGVGYCPPPSGIDDVINAAKVYVGTKVMASAKSEQIQFLATLGEGKETLQMLQGACRTLLKIGPSLKNYGKTLLRAARAPKRLAKKLYIDAENAWMYVRMGWRPFAGECENLAAAIMEQQEQRWKCRFGKKKELSFSNNVAGSFLTSNNIKSWHDKTYDEQTTVRAGVIMQAKVGGYPDTWGLRSIPQTVWELTTLSWCVDYFLNIGDLIAACTPDTYWSPFVTWTTVHRSIEETIRSKNVTSLGYGPPMLDGGYRRKTTKRILRQPGVMTGLVYKGMLNMRTQKEECLDTLAVTRQKISGIIKSLSSPDLPKLDWRPRK